MMNTHPVFLLSTRLSISVSLAMLTGLLNAMDSKAPTAKIENVTDTHWGTQVSDPYRYMENMQADDVQAWFKGQADYTESVLSKLPGRASMIKRMRELNAGKPYRISRIHRLDDGTLFYMKRAADENLYKLYVLNAELKAEKLLVDPEALGANDEHHYSLETYVPSPNGRYVVYGIAKGGSEETVYHTLEISSGKQVGKPIDNIETAYNKPQWLQDSSGYFYSRRQTIPDNAPATDVYKKTQVRLHKLDAGSAQDRVIAGYQISTLMQLSDVDFPSISITSGSKFAVVKIKHGDSNELTLYSTPVGTLFDDKINWRKICDVEDLVTDFAVHENDVYLLTANDAPRFKVVRSDLRKPGFSKTVTVVPAGEQVIDSIVAAKDALYADIKEDGINHILRIAYNDKARPVVLPLPQDTSGYVTSISPSLDGIDVYVNSWIKGGLIYRYNHKPTQFNDTGLMPKGRYDDLPGYTTTEVKVKSHDGVMVPLSIIHRSDLKLDGGHPTLLKGYGSYGISMSVFFDSLRFAWLEKGGIYAVAHVRGGGEYGHAWHLAGKMQNKPNTWKDFIASAEYLIDKGYTSKKHLAGLGGSAGGILIGRAITEQPDLFGAAIIQVGMSDTIRAETTTNGVPNIQEFGTVTEKGGFEGLLSMSPYQHIIDGVNYPAVLLTHGINDNRVNPWMSGKMAARLQAATASGKPVLLRVDYDAGHGIGSTRDQRLQQMADIYSFLFWQLGDTR